MRRHLYFLMLVLFAATALWVAAQPTAEEMEQQRARLEAIRKQPDQFARLRDNFNAFQSDRRKAAIIKLDQEMHELPPLRQTRYWKTLERYADWLDQLKKKDPAAYQAIHAAPDASARLALIKERRDREWMESQPKAYRVQWKSRQGEERVKYITKLREEEHKRHQTWVISQRFAKELEAAKLLPCRLSDFGVALKSKDKGKEPAKVVNKVEAYFVDYLQPYLTPEEEKQLKDAEGTWPDYPMALVEIASRRTPALPPKSKEPRKFADLPKPIQHTLTQKKGVDVPKGKLKNQYMQFDGSQYYASRVVEMALKNGKLPFENEYLACNFKSLSKPMQKFVEDDLVPLVKKDPADNAKLSSSEGKWPDYPQTIQELARKHGLNPPWHLLPDQDKWHWDRYRPERFQTPALDKGKDKEE